MGKLGLKITKQDVKDILKKRWWVMLIELAVIGVILLIDLLTKNHIEKTMYIGQSHTLIKGFIDITFTVNTGAGFGIFAGNTTALTVVTAIVLVVVSVFLLIAQKESEWLRVSLLFIVGGGIGNLVDRINPGYVRDFIQFAFWEEFAIFNVADIFVTVGTGMLIVVLIVILFKEGQKNKKEFEEQQASAEQPAMQDPLDAPVNLNPMLKSENDYNFAEPSDNTENGGDNTETHGNGAATFTVSEVAPSGEEKNKEDKSAEIDDAEAE